MCKVLITGARGVLGRALVEALNEYEVYSTDIKGEGRYLDVTNYELVKAFLEDLGFSKGDVIIHLAALVGGEPSLKKPREYFYVNIIGTLNILHAMLTLGIRNLIYLSSFSTLGSNIPLPITEDTPLQPVNAYGASKLCAEILVKTYCNLYGLRAIIFRTTMMYGEGQEEKNVVQQLVNCMVTKQPFIIYDSGEHTREFLYVADASKVIAKAIPYLLKLDKPYEIFILGTEKPYSINEIAKIASRISPFEVVHKVVKRWDFSQKTLMTRIKKELGVDTKTFMDIKEGVRRCYRTR